MATGEIQRLTRRGRVTSAISALAFLVVLLLAAGVVACQRAPEEARARGDAVPWDSEEYLVYSALIREEKARWEEHQRPHVRQVVIRQQTGTERDEFSFVPRPFPFDPEVFKGDEDWLPDLDRFGMRRPLLRPGVAGASGELADDYARKNMFVYFLSNRFKVDVPVALFSEEQWRELATLDAEALGRYGCRRLVKDYPGSRGVLRLSRVGFDRPRKHALVYVSDRARMAGVSYYVLLQKKDGAWAIKQREFTRGQMDD